MYLRKKILQNLTEVSKGENLNPKLKHSQKLIYHLQTVQVN